MKRVTILAYVCLFLKYPLYVHDSSYFFLLTNLLGAALLWWNFKDTKRKVFSAPLTIYFLLTVLLLVLRLFGMETTAIALTSMNSFFLSFLLLASHFYLFFFPIISFADLVKESRDNVFVKVIALLAGVLVIAFFFLPFLIPVLIAAIIVLEFVSLFLVKESVPVEIEG